ncbi:MAG: SMP-30/gluconolactonase/LRE family protein [Actinomycetota bacterium]
MPATRKVLGLVIGALLIAAPTIAQPFPEVIPLPTGFQPEGIAVGRGATFFVGSIPTGAIFRGSLRSGTGEVLVPGQAGRSAIGLEVDRRGRLFVAGDGTGGAWVYDGRTGDELAAYQLATGTDPTFVNDVVVTRQAAWFTDSFRAVLYRVPVGPKSLGDQASVEVLPLTGDFVLQDGFNTNGIEVTPDRSKLVIVQSNTGKLFTVDPRTGVTDEIELAGGDAAFGDGLLLDGTTLYVVQNELNRIAVVELAADGSSGTVVDHLTDPDLDIPTTVAKFGSALYAVNSRFGIPEPETAEYSVVRVEI